MPARMVTRALPLLLLTTCLVGALPAVAGAAEAYRLEAFPCDSLGGGQIDAAGTMYAACGGTVRIVAHADGATRSAPVFESLARSRPRVWVPPVRVDCSRLAPRRRDDCRDANDARTGHWRAVPDVPAVRANLRDVAPSPDGQFLYSVDDRITRYARQGDGSYLRDGWQAARFPYGGTDRILAGLFIATDALGFIYASSTTYDTVVKLRPDGSYITRFGAYADGNPGDASLWAEGSFYWNIGGVAPTRDGRRVYVTEIGNSRVQRFDFDAATSSYVVNRVWGNSAATDPQRKGRCDAGFLAAPYDVGVDPWGFVYVANTTCGQVKKYTADGAHVFTMRVANATWHKVHGIAVDGHGNAATGETERRIVRTTPEPGPWPALRPVLHGPTDLVAPVLRSVTMPATSTTRQIAVAIDAADAVGVTQMRVAGSDGAWGPWQGYSPNLAWTLPDQWGVNHTLYVQVRDGAGHESAVVSDMTLLQRDVVGPGPGPDVTAPITTSVRINAGAATTGTRAVTLTIAATDDVAVTHLRIANEDGTFGAWIAYAPNVAWTLTAGSGTKLVYVQTRDAAWNVSANTTDTISYVAA